MGKRRYGTGSLYRRASDGRWIGRLPDGRGGRVHVTGIDREDVLRRLEEQRRLRDRTATSSTARGGERLAELVERYLATIAPLRVRPKHIATARAAMAAHVTPVCGSIRVTQLQPADLQRVVDRMVARRYAPQTIHNTLRYVSVALRQAMREELVDRNVASLVTLPPRRRERLPSLTTAEVRRLLTATRVEPFWTVWVLAATTGMRIGELLGLLWRDVTEATVTVTGQWRRVRLDEETVRWDRVEPKTTQSRRTIPLTSIGREAMRAQRRLTRSAKTVFTNGDGDPLDAARVSRAFDATLKALGLPDVRLHSLRHSAAVTMLDALGGDIRAVSATLGHSTIGITVDTYGQDADEARKRAAAAMDRAMAMEDVG